MLRKLLTIFPILIVLGANGTTAYKCDPEYNQQLLGEVYATINDDKTAVFTCFYSMGASYVYNCTGTVIPEPGWWGEDPKNPVCIQGADICWWQANQCLKGKSSVKLK